MHVRVEISPSDGPPAIGRNGSRRLRLVRKAFVAPGRAAVLGEWRSRSLPSPDDHRRGGTEGRGRQDDHLHVPRGPRRGPPAGHPDRRRSASERRHWSRPPRTNPSRGSRSSKRPPTACWSRRSTGSRARRSRSSTPRPGTSACSQGHRRADAVVVPTRIGGVETARVEAVLEVVPRKLPVGLVICSARTYTRDYQDVVAAWVEADVEVWGSVPERSRSRPARRARSSPDGIDTYRGVWRRALRAVARVVNGSRGPERRGGRAPGRAGRRSSRRRNGRGARRRCPPHPCCARSGRSDCGRLRRAGSRTRTCTRRRPRSRSSSRCPRAGTA